MANDTSLSTRVPVSLERRFRALAAARGRTVQDVLRTLVADYVTQAGPEPPELDAILRQIRDLEPRLRGRGVDHLWIFGSVARGANGPQSDVDVAVSFAAGAEPSIVTLAGVRSDLTDALGRPVDVVQWKDLLAAGDGRAPSAFAPVF